MRIDKDNIRIILILLVVCLSLGYAYINSDLNINGTAQVNHANWDVHWANIQVTNGSVSGANVVTVPTIQNQTTVNYSVILNLPGDYYEFTVDAVNGGQIDAMIDTIDSKLNGATITTLPAYLKYSVTYYDDRPLEVNHELKANTTETYKVRIEYNTDIELSQIPATNQTLTLQFTVTYRQATENATEVDHSIIRYTSNITTYGETGENRIWLNQTVPNGITLYNTVAEVNAHFNMPFYLKHRIKDNGNGIVTESYVEFIVTEANAQQYPTVTPGTYTLRGAGATANGNSYNNDSPYYEANKAQLLAAFGSSKCSIYSDYTRCEIGGLGASARLNGRVGADRNNWGCDIEANGSSGCSYLD